MRRPTRKSFEYCSKLHLHKCTLRGRCYTIIMPRSGIHIRWATNFYHETWHILGTMNSTQFLGHLMWDLSFHKDPYTYVYIDQSLLVCNPFDARPSDPILIGKLKPPSELCLYLKNKRPPSHKSYRLKSQSLTKIINDKSARGEFYRKNSLNKQILQVSRIKGVITLSGGMHALQSEGVSAAFMYTIPGDYFDKMDYHGIWQKDKVDGEFQIFHDFYHQVGAAKSADRLIRQKYPAPRSKYEEDLIIDRIQSLSWKLFQARRRKKT